MDQILFSPASGHIALWRQVTDRFPWALDVLRDVTVDRALLLIGDCPSQLYAITRKTSYKVLDWGRDLQLLGAGNQISEAGILLRGLLPQDSMESFLAGEALAWNPFVLTERERMFLAFHLCEVDQLTIGVLDDLALLNTTDPIDSAQAARITCKAFLRVLSDARSRVSPSDLPALRKALELAGTIAEELDLSELAVAVGAVPGQRLPKPLKIPKRGRGPAAHHRRTTKNADHQTIPRFEQLVDLGFLRKPVAEDASPRDGWEARCRWRYERLPSCRAWAEERVKARPDSTPWEWSGFARAARSSGLAGAGRNHAQATPEVIASFLWAAYSAVGRPIGHTPFHSIALIAMIDAAVNGLAIEMRDFHRLMLTIKSRGFLADSVFFASGNEIDKMFLLLRPDFVEGVRQFSEELKAPQSG